MELKHYIGGQQVEEPVGWGEFTEDIKRDFRLRLIGTQYPIDVTFVGNGYMRLFDLHASDPCGIEPYVVQQRCSQGWEDAIRCAIVLADVEFNLDRCEAKVKATDDGIGARINNNKNIDVFPAAEQTKGGDALTPATPVSIAFFDPGAALGSYLPETRTAYDWKEALRHCVSYITDLDVSIVSDWYDALPDDERWAIIDGEELRTHDDANSRTKYSFDKLFNELGKKYNLWAAAERDLDGSPVLRVEPESYFYGAASTVSFPKTRDLVRKTDQGRLYATVRVGGEDSIKDTDSNFSLPFLVLRGFTEEVFALKCECNTDEELDLMSEWIIDSNVIEDVVMNGNDEWDDRMFLIQYDHTSNQATKGDYLFTNSTPYLYNEQLQNFRVLNRWTFHCGVGVDVGSASDGSFAAFLSNGPIQTYTYTGSLFGPNVDTAVRFNNDYSSGGFDPDNNYGNGTPQGTDVSTANSRFTAPAQGYYFFSVYVRVQMFKDCPLSNVGAQAQIVYRRFNSANAQVDAGIEPFTQMFANGGYDLTAGFAFSLDPGDYVSVSLNSGPVNFCSGLINYTVDTKIVEANFQLDASSIGGGTLIQSDPDDFFGDVYVFERASTLEQWKEVRDDTSLSVAVGTRDTMYRGYPMSASRNLKTGATKWELIANRQQ